MDVSPSGGALLPGGSATEVTLSLNAASSNLALGSYQATIWFTNMTDGVVQSRTVSLTIIQPPSITNDPSDLTLIGGMTATFTVGVTGGLPLNFQWQHNGVDLTNGGRITGAQFTLTDGTNIFGAAASVLTITNIKASDGGNYRLVASNAAGVDVSENAKLTVTPSGPVLVQQPADEIILFNSTAQLPVVVDGTSPFTYQWRQDNVNLKDAGNVSGSTNSTLTIKGATAANIGNYTVVISNTLGTVTSTGAVLTVDVAETNSQVAQNGGFETGDFTFWTESGNSSGFSVSSNAPAVHTGKYGALLSASGTLGYLSESVATVPGQTYSVSLWLENPDGLTPNEFAVSWDGSTLFDETNIDDGVWTQLQFYVLASGANTLLQLGARDDSGPFALDDVQIIPLANADGPPIIVTPPANRVAVQGGAARFTVLAAGGLPLFYHWQFEATNISGATNATLTLTNLTANQAGAYSVTVSNAQGSVTSGGAQLTVLTGESELITFDDLPDSVIPVPQGYNNLSWCYFFYIDAVQTPQSGYYAGMLSAPNVAFNNNGAPANISSTAPFSLLSAYLTAAWNDNLQLEVRGYNVSTLEYDNTYTLSATTPTRISFNYIGVTSVQFISSGGSPHIGYFGNGTYFVIDNISVNVTPTTPAPPPETTLYSFGGGDGGYPSSTLIRGADGTFIGEPEDGGANGFGVRVQNDDQRCGDDVMFLGQLQRVSMGRPRAGERRDVVRSHAVRRD